MTREIETCPSDSRVGNISALETFVIIALYKSTFTIPCHTNSVVDHEETQFEKTCTTQKTLKSHIIWILEKRKKR